LIDPADVACQVGSSSPSLLSLNFVWHCQSLSLIPGLQTLALWLTVSCPWT